MTRIQLLIPKMRDDSDLRSLYRSFQALRGRRFAEAEIGRLLSALGSELHGAGKKDNREFGAYGACFNVDLRDRFGRMCYYGAVPETRELTIFQQLCRKGGVVWDIGANFGLYSILAAKKVGTTGSVFAVEPNRQARVLLKKNRTVNNLCEQMAIFQCAVSDAESSVSFYETEDSAFSGLANTGRSNVIYECTVQSKTLDSLWRQHGKKPINLLKIDVEGYENEVLRGATEAISNSPEIVVLFEHSPKNLDADQEKLLRTNLSAMIESGMSLWTIEEQIALASIASDQVTNWLPTFSGNLFLVRTDSAAEKRLVRLAEKRFSPETQQDERLVDALQRTVELVSEALEGLRREQKTQGQRASRAARSQRQSVAELRKDLTTRDQMVHQLSASIDAYDSKVASYRHTLNTNDRLIDELREGIESRDAKITGQRETLNKHEKSGQDYASALEVQGEKLDEFRSLYEQREQANNDLRAALTSHDAKVESIRKSLAGKDARIDELREGIESRDTKISGLRETLDKHESADQGFASITKVQEEKLANIRSLYQQREKENVALRAALASQTEKIESLKQALRNNRTLNAQLREAIILRESKIMHLRDVIGDPEPEASNPPT